MLLSSCLHLPLDSLRSMGCGSTYAHSGPISSTWVSFLVDYFLSTFHVLHSSLPASCGTHFLLVFVLLHHSLADFFGSTHKSRSNPCPPAATSNRHSTLSSSSFFLDEKSAPQPMSVHSVKFPQQDISVFLTHLHRRCKDRYSISSSPPFVAKPLPSTANLIRPEEHQAHPVFFFISFFLQHLSSCGIHILPSCFSSSFACQLLQQHKESWSNLCPPRVDAPHGQQIAPVCVRRTSPPPLVLIPRIKKSVSGFSMPITINRYIFAGTGRDGHS